MISHLNSSLPAKLDLIAVEGPRAELHEANLLVEGKIFDVDGAAALVQGGWNPQHRTGVLDHHVALKTHL